VTSATAAENKAVTDSVDEDSSVTVETAAETAALQAAVSETVSDSTTVSDSQVQVSGENSADSELEEDSGATHPEVVDSETGAGAHPEVEAVSVTVSVKLQASKVSVTVSVTVSKVHEDWSKVAGASDQWTEGNSLDGVASADSDEEPKVSGAAHSVTGVSMEWKVEVDSAMVIMLTDDDEDEDSSSSAVSSSSEEDEDSKAAATASSASCCSWLEIQAEMGPVDSDDEDEAAAAAAAPALSLFS